MKRIKLFLIICGITICACGCNQNSNKEFSENSSEKDAIISIFGEYTSIKGTGIVQINEKEDENDRTYIYYLVKVPSLENYKNELKKEKSEQNQENILAKMYNEVQEDVTQEVISKIDKLYINKNVNKIRIEVGVVWPYGNHNYTKPGEKIVGSKIAYIKTFNFTREDYKDFLKQYKEEK